MFEHYPNKKKNQRSIKNKYTHHNGSLLTNRHFSSEQIADLMLNRPELRLRDNVGNEGLAYILAGIPEDPHLQDLFQLVTHDSIGKAIVANDDFIGSYPPQGSISYPSDFRKLATMPTGEPTGIADSQVTGNVGFLGRTKSGKTSCLIQWLSCREFLEGTCIVAFVKKRELRHLATISEISDLVITLRIEELKLSLFQPPPGVPESVWCNEITKVFAHSYGRYSAQRIMGQLLSDLMSNRPKGVYPTLRQLIQVIDEFRPRFGMREAAYKESILWCLIDLLNCTGKITDYGYSDFLEHLYSEPGLRIIEAEVISPEHLAFLAAYWMRWFYLKQTYAGKERL